MRLALIGDPVAHSMSPQLHRGFLAEIKLSGTYEALRVPAGAGGGAIERLRAAAYRGVNVTTPLKEEAFAHCARHDGLARESGSVNTVVFEGALACGYNTDGAGALGAVQAAAARQDVVGLNVLVLGAGPTARAAASALRDARALVTVWNRTRERAERLSDALRVDLWRPGTQVDVVLSTLPPQSALEDDDVRAAVLAAAIIVDANYAERATLGRVLGRAVIDGSEMLRASARASFDLFMRQHRLERGVI
jgi:shikimate dehydrogenase